MKKETVTVPCNSLHQARACPHADHKRQGRESEMTGIPEMAVTHMVRDIQSLGSRPYLCCWNK